MSLSGLVQVDSRWNNMSCTRGHVIYCIIITSLIQETARKLPDCLPKSGDETTQSEGERRNCPHSPQDSHCNILYVHALRAQWLIVLVLVEVAIVTNWRCYNTRV